LKAYPARWMRLSAATLLAVQGSGIFRKIHAPAVELRAVRRPSPVRSQRSDRRISECDPHILARRTFSKHVRHTKYDTHSMVQERTVNAAVSDPEEGQVSEAGHRR
jgi:hypothetical protein